MQKFGSSSGMPTWQKLLLAGVGIFLVITLVALGYFYFQYQNLKKDPNAEQTAEVKALVAKVGKHYDLPTDETPTVATVSDKSKVTGQPFFAKAENGDKILIYRKNKLAILYRPSEDKLINVGPIDLDAATGNTSGSSTTPAATTAKVGIYNASSTVGLTNTAASQLTAAITSGITIAEKANANSKTLGKVVVVDMSGSNKELAAKIASTLGGSVGDLPAGEAKPNVDVAVYMGK